MGSKEKKTTEKVTQGTKRQLRQSISGSPKAKRARMSEKPKETSTKTTTTRSEVGFAVHSNKLTQEVPLGKHSQSSSSFHKWLPVVQLHKMPRTDSDTSISTTKKSFQLKAAKEESGVDNSRPLDTSKSTALDYSIYELSSDSDNSTSFMPMMSKARTR